MQEKMHRSKYFNFNKAVGGDMKQVLKFNLHLKDLSKLRNTSGDYK